MVRISELNLYVGSKEEYRLAVQQGMKIVCALNWAKGFVTHQSVVGWTGRGCNKDNPYYLFKREPDAIYLNMIDGNDPKYVNVEMINPALDFIHQHLQKDNSVFIYCSLWELRSPSLALMYMLEQGLIEKDANTINAFRTNYYPDFAPKNGNLQYIKQRWGI
ncbi:MAG: hypothetical protein K9G38_04785 [Bacteroidales bacterium]|nr:hypothetical protein [Bacteroidales bacterium]